MTMRNLRTTGLAMLVQLSVACLDLSAIPVQPTQDAAPMESGVPEGPFCSTVRSSELGGATYLGEVHYCPDELVCEANQCAQEPSCAERRAVASCRLVTVERSGEVITSFAANDAHLYWTTSGTADDAERFLNDGELHRLNLATLRSERLLGNLQLPGDLAVNERWIVWSEQPAGESTQFFKLRVGAAPAPIPGAPSVPGRPLIAPNHDEAWFMQRGLLRADLEGDRDAQEVSTSPYSFADATSPSVAVDDDYVYFIAAANCGAPRIVRAPRSGGQFEPVAGSERCTITSLLGAVGGSVVFTADYPLTLVGRVPGQGGLVEELATFAAKYNPAAQLHAGFVYLPIGASELRPRRLARFSLADLEQRTLVAAFGAPTADQSWGVDWLTTLDRLLPQEHGAFWGSEYVHGASGQLGFRVLHYTPFTH